jgi:high-affinity nickel permease
LSSSDAILKTQEKLLETISTVEGKRLDDLKNARETVFKYALPSVVIDGIGGVVGALITPNFIILLPMIAFLILIYFLAKTLDMEKLAERQEIMKYSEDTIDKIMKQELGLLERE